MKVKAAGLEAIELTPQEAAVAREYLQWQITNTIDGLGRNGLILLKRLNTIDLPSPWPPLEDE